MPKSSSTDRRWLEQHGGKWRVTIAVPRTLHGRLGTRLKKHLHTDSLAMANKLKHKAVADLRARIEREEDARLGKPAAIVREALEVAEYFGSAVEHEDVKAILDGIAERVEDIKGPPVSATTNERTGHPESLYDPARVALASDFGAIARGEATPLATHLEAFHAANKVKARTRADADRAIRYLSDWCRKENLPISLQAITKKVATKFADGFTETSGGLAPITQNKYLSRLSQYWQYLAKREFVATDVWAGLTIKVEQTEHGEEERAFTDEEVRKLLAGAPPRKMMDLMTIAALTGARIDAIVCLKVKDAIDGCFTFKRQKKERSARDVPIHPALNEIVQRRSAGKDPNDPLFPEWPAPKKEGSTRERSFKASNQFTEYRRERGVDEVVPGKRRSLVNFHSFRRWFITKAERAGNKDTLIAAIVGHKRSGLTLGRYSEGPEMRQARRCVASVKLPPLDRGPVKEARPLTPRRRAA
ncbi:tyrosine-type recombinase/integrase [Bosea vestrisii]|uniref:Tyrosine-type recombinase/integrase n=1 Tax=Bosea vestrisii TaxID=151416 RepID=A0ABW0HAA8_9HYPH